MQDTRDRCILYLDRMTELLAVLETAAEEERLHVLNKFKELLALLSRQKAVDEAKTHPDSRPLADATRAIAQMVSQKNACLKGGEKRIKHLREKITGTTSADDRLALEEILHMLENLSTDDECKWDVDIMTHWFKTFNAYKDQREEEQPPSTDIPGEKQTPSRQGCLLFAAPDTAGLDTSIAAPPSTDIPGEEEENEGTLAPSTPAPDTAIAVPPSTGTQSEVGPTAEPPDSVASVMQAYESEVIRFVTSQLLRAETEIESLRKQHLASYLSDIDNTLRVIATVASNIDVAAIKAMVLAARSDGRSQTGIALGTLLDTVQQQFERDPDESNREWWHMLIKSVTVLRDFNYKRNALLSERTKLVVQDVDEQRYAIVARAKAIARSASTLHNKDTRLYVAGVVDDIVRRLHS